MNNFKKNQPKDGEYICPKCNGTGWDPKQIDYINYIINEKINKITVICDFCMGDGVVDWIENIIGKKSILYDNYCYDHIEIEIIKNSLIPFSNLKGSVT